MKLAIRRSAAPTTPLSQLSAHARERGLDGVELSHSDLDAIGDGGPTTGPYVAIYVESLDAVASEQTAQTAARLGAFVVAARGAVPLTSIPALDASYRRHGATLLLSHGTDVEETAQLVDALDEAQAAAVKTAWELRPLEDRLSDASAVLLTSGPTLQHIRLFGGGPELGDDDAVGTGGLIASIALARFGGAITIGPSSEARLAEWGKWIAGTLKTGCGTAYEKKAKASDVELDIRAVEPKDRMETIMGTYRSLSPGRTMHVTFDHDPSCMYYTLQATEPEGSFRFEKKGDGPDVWHADVTKNSL